MDESLEGQLISRFWNDIDPRINLKKLPETTYHYTSLEGFIGITDSGQIRMTNSDFLNDSTEINYITEILPETIDKLERNLENEYGDGIIENEYYRVFSNQLNTANNMRLKDKKEALEIYVLSMSKSKDSLTLWSNYSNNEGYNIGFDTKYLIENMKANQENENYYIVHSDVIYIREDQITILADELQDTFKFILELKPEIIELENHLLAFLKSVLTSYSIFFKNQAFKVEEEYRIAYTTLNKAEVNFRNLNGIIIPYISTEFNKSAIKSVSVGPKNNSDIAEKGIKFYLERKKYNVDNIDIMKSKVPLRY